MWQVFSTTRSASSGVSSRHSQRAQDVGHALAVVDVHLTAVGLDEEALHASPPSAFGLGLAPT
jgi:hypothetical protein